jgi:beta-phosphoglucomutase-like phosphatase (HAD superfamily)
MTASLPEGTLGVDGGAGTAAAVRKPLPFEALIFDVDGTLADTEELHRQAFNEAFFACGVDWRWSPHLYAELLQITGGKERIAAYIDRLPLSAVERSEFLRLIPQLHASKTRLYRELVELGHLRPRAGVKRLMMEARSAGIQLAIASTTSPANVESLLRASFGNEAPYWFAAIATGDVVSRKKPARYLRAGAYDAGLAAAAGDCPGGFGDRGAVGEGCGPVYGGDTELMDDRTGFCRGRSGSDLAGGS